MEIQKSLPSHLLFAKTYADAGWSSITRELDTKLNNRLLYTGGIGIDMLTLYDICLKIEYSFNQLGEKGLFYTRKQIFDRQEKYLALKQSDEDCHLQQGR